MDVEMDGQRKVQTGWVWGHGRIVDCFSFYYQHGTRRTTQVRTRDHLRARVTSHVTWNTLIASLILETSWSRGLNTPTMATALSLPSRFVFRSSRKLLSRRCGSKQK